MRRLQLTAVEKVIGNQEAIDSSIPMRLNASCVATRCILSSVVLAQINKQEHTRAQIIDGRKATAKNVLSVAKDIYDTYKEYAKKKNQKSQQKYTNRILTTKGLHGRGDSSEDSWSKARILLFSDIVGRTSSGKNVTTDTY